jgi:hypothetical protein
MNLSDRTKQLIVGAVAAALIGAVTYLLGQGAIPAEWAVLINTLLGFGGGAAVIKSS